MIKLIRLDAGAIGTVTTRLPVIVLTGGQETGMFGRLKIGLKS
jgi:hypothetical protein